VGVDTLGFVVVLVHRAPLGLEQKQVEVDRVGDVGDQADFYVVNVVGEGAEISVLAPFYLVRVLETKFSFVFLLMIQALDPVVRPLAGLFVLTPVGLGELAQFRCKKVVIATLVFETVEEKTTFVVVRRVELRALVPLKFGKIQMLSSYATRVQLNS
jgi:hypothetical protein